MKKEIISKLEQLSEYMKILREYQQHPIEEIRDNKTLKAAVERYMQVSLECILDVGEIIISKEGLGKPESYREVIQILGENNIIPKEFAEKFAPAAGFRNILVHAYSKIDVDELYNNLQTRLDDFEEFAKHIAKHLK
ncbi:MAG: hypothetical protein B6U72_07280 [Candidatus Altiarchaeales archaeon ex4484_2]|nr:MAG: hypothetical protein B6U72_07280 [Candidatus Altiarchaeales archaeon ex4484_2]